MLGKNRQATAKLYFRYGAMGSAKTLNLLAVAHNYELQGKRVYLIKPEIDNRFGKEYIKSRAGLQRKADLLVNFESILNFEEFQGISCILVDEAQFISKKMVDQLRRVTIELNIPVICYGLRSDFKSNLFEGSKRLLEMADTIEEVKTTCHYCNKKATMNLRHVGGVATIEGPSIQLGTEEMYFPTCYRCYHEALQDSKKAEKQKAFIHSEV
ncbi:MAG: thymidine kinase [Parachlamydiales bacterium]|nr:thymidine kinase [Parachlamydiales bacterium]